MSSFLGALNSTWDDARGGPQPRPAPCRLRRNRRTIPLPTRGAVGDTCTAWPVLPIWDRGIIARARHITKSAPRILRTASRIRGLGALAVSDRPFRAMEHAAGPKGDDLDRGHAKGRVVPTIRENRYRLVVRSQLNSRGRGDFDPRCGLRAQAPRDSSTGPDFFKEVCDGVSEAGSKGPRVVHWDSSTSGRNYEPQARAYQRDDSAVVHRSEAARARLDPALLDRGRTQRSPTVSSAPAHLHLLYARAVGTRAGLLLLVTDAGGHGLSWQMTRAAASPLSRNPIVFGTVTLVE